jgi:hypothetical protein
MPKRANPTTNNTATTAAARVEQTEINPVVEDEQPPQVARVVFTRLFFLPKRRAVSPKRRQPSFASDEAADAFRTSAPWNLFVHLMSFTFTPSLAVPECLQRRMSRTFSPTRAC